MKLRQVICQNVQECTATARCTVIVFLYSMYFQIMKSEVMRIGHELTAQKEKIKENTEKIKVNKTLPYLVSNVIEVR